MSYCLNPSCENPSDPENANQECCQSCGCHLLVNDRYRGIRKLGEGGFGITYEVDDKGTSKVLKVLQKTDAKSVALFKREAKVLKELKHPGIPKLEDDYFIYQADIYTLHCLVMEKIEGLNLEKWLEQQDNQSITEAQAIAWLSQLIDILEVLHQKRFFHRDIKPSNIMLRQNQMVLIDFGIARELTGKYWEEIHDKGATTKINTLPYASPEQMEGKARYQSDFYSLGVTFVYLLTGKNPNELAKKDEKLLWRDSASQISKPFADLIDWLIEPDIEDRPPNTKYIRKSLEAIKYNQIAELPKIKNAPRRWRLLQRLCGSVAVTGLVMGVRYLGILQSWELAAFDGMMRSLAVETPDSRIFIIAVDENDRQYQDAQNMQRRDSLADEALTQLWQKLAPHKPRVIGLDIFRPRAFESKLAATVQSQPFIAICAGESEKEPAISPPPGTPLDRIGFAEMPTDPDFRIRRHLLTMDADRTCNTTESFGLRVAERYLNQKIDLNKIGAKKLELDAGGYQLPKQEAFGYQIMLKYRRAKFEQKNLREILNNSLDNQLSALVRDRIILIGAVNENDLHFTPYSTGFWPERMPGVEIHAHKISQIVSAVLDRRGLISWWPEWAEWLWVWFWAVVSGLLVVQSKSRVYSTVWLVLIPCGLGGTCFLFLVNGVWIPLIPAAFAVAIAIGTGAAYTAWRNR